MTAEFINFTKCDIFTPSNISEKMAKYINKTGNLLEPSVGTGNLLRYLDFDLFDKIDIFDVKKCYLDQIKEHPKLHKYETDFLQFDFGNQKYQNIILNPPYIKIQDLSNQYRNNIKNNWGYILCGNFDIYYVFLLKCLELLSDDGTMVAIIPNTYLHSKSAKKFREFLIKHSYILEIIDFGSDKVFQNIGVYTCITIFTKTQKNTFIYNNHLYDYSKITDCFLNFIPDNPNRLKLSYICKIKNGLATLANNIFIHNEPLNNEECWRKVRTSQQIKWIIYPYENKKIITENTFKEKYPLTYQYLLLNKNNLLNRDKGLKIYPEWYSYGRTQSLTPPSQNEVIFIPNFIDPKNFNLNISESMLFSGCICIELTDKNYNYECIIKCIKDNLPQIEKMSTKRGSGWISLSTKTLLNLYL